MIFGIVRSVFLILFFFVCVFGFGQNSNHEAFLKRMVIGSPLPEKLLSSRSAVIYSTGMKEKEFEDIQLSFQKSGIDAVTYVDIDVMLAGRDAARALSFDFNKRDIENLLIFYKTKYGYAIYITPFNTKDTFVEISQKAWQVEDTSLQELLKKIYRASGSLKRENLLINEFPEIDLPLHVISGRRAEFFAIDLKVDPTAVPKFGFDATDKELGEIITSLYPLKYKITDAGVSERDLRAQGNLYVLCYVYSRGTIAKRLLEYDNSKSEKNFVSITYQEGQATTKSLPADEYVYKFYFKHIDSGNIFLGTKWDADVSWQQALRNHLMAFKAELKLN